MFLERGSRPTTICCVGINDGIGHSLFEIKHCCPYCQQRCHQQGVFVSYRDEPRDRVAGCSNALTPRVLLSLEQLIGVVEPFQKLAKSLGQILLWRCPTRAIMAYVI